MTVHYYMFGNCQYQLAEGALAEAWLAAWIMDHTEFLVENENNGQNFFPLIPPHAEGCLSQLDFEYHFENTDFEEFDGLYQEVVAAIAQGGVATYDCDSSMGSQSEDPSP